MSTADRFADPSHLDDAAVAEYWASRRASTGTPAELHPHVDTCAECRARVDALDRWLNDLRADVQQEADELFPAERLAAQRGAILDRLEALGSPGRVIAFPGQTVPQTSRVHRQRWIAAAAAAGLLIGLGAGQMLHLTRPVSTTDVASNRQALRPAAIVDALSSTDDAIFYSDAAITTPHVEALQALDAITPRVRDIEPSR